MNVSVKLSSLYSQFDPIDPAGTSAAVRNRLRPILRLARQRGAFVNIDMEQFAYKDATLRIFKEVFDDPQIIARGVMQDLEHPRLGKMRTTRNPVLFDHDGPAIDRHAPMLGEHSEEVLAALGYSPAAIRDLVAAGVTRLATAKGAVEAAE